MGLTDLAVSLNDTQQTVIQVGDLVSATLFESHHNILMDCRRSATNASAAPQADGRWRPAIAVAMAPSRRLSSACHNLGETVRVGVSVGSSAVRQDQVFGGKNDLRGDYVVAEADWAMPGAAHRLCAGTLWPLGRSLGPWLWHARRGGVGRPHSH